MKRFDVGLVLALLLHTRVLLLPNTARENVEADVWMGPVGLFWYGMLVISTPCRFGGIA